MKGQLIRISDSGGFVTLLFKLKNRGYGRTYTGKQYRNYASWSVFKIGDWVGGLQWKDAGKGIIDADSPVHLI